MWISGPFTHAHTDVDADLNWTMDSSLHYEIWKYCQGTSRVQAEVLQKLRVRCPYAKQDGSR